MPNSEEEGQQIYIELMGVKERPKAEHVFGVARQFIDDVILSIESDI
jgi:hypothetical protein